MLHVMFEEGESHPPQRQLRTPRGPCLQNATAVRHPKFCELSMIKVAAHPLHTLQQGHPRVEGVTKRSFEGQSLVNYTGIHEMGVHTRVTLVVY